MCEQNTNSFKCNYEYEYNKLMEVKSYFWWKSSVFSFGAERKSNNDRFYQTLHR